MNIRDRILPKHSKSLKIYHYLKRFEENTFRYKHFLHH